jgi:23S rRNA (cytidine1920-2'-O)/16S rRNA (cytidine1409-2'-O)-methyltransferase
LQERTNFRHLNPNDLYQPGQPYADLGVVDVSFISLTKVLPALWQLLQPPREVVLLVKPQFEVGREKVGKKGVVREPKDHTNAILQVWDAAQTVGWHFKGLTWSPLVGPAGNIEYLLWLGMDDGMEIDQAPIDSATVQQVTQAAHQSLKLRAQPQQTTEHS